MEKLSTRHQEFINEYLKCFNATDAYLRIYPKAKYDTARANSSRLLADANISAEIARRLAERRMSADEVLDRLTDIARGDLGDYFDTFGQVDMLKLRQENKSKLIKKLKQRTITKIGKGETDEDTEIHDVEIEMYSAHEALRDLGKIHGLFVNKTELTGKDGKPIETHATVTLADWRKTATERLQQAKERLDG